MLRVLLFRSPPANAPAARKVAEIAARFSQGWETIVNWRGILLLWKSDPSDLPAIELPFKCGALFGAVFDRSAGVSKPLSFTAQHEARLWDWLKTGAESLMRECWGPFVAVLHDAERDRVIVTRDAAGGRPIFLSKGRDFDILFTHAEDFLLCAPETPVNRSYLSAFVAQSRIVTEASAFEGVREILPGQRWISGRGESSVEMIWTPSGGARNLSFAAGCEEVRQCVFECGAAWGALNRPIVHRLSGGVDSAIVLAALARGGADVVCLNERPIGFPEGDEWEAAQASAALHGARIVASSASPERVDYSRLLDAELHAKPSLADLSYAEPSLLECLDALEASVVTSGQGGDQIFQRGRAPYVCADAIVDRIGPKELITAMLDTARHSRTHVWEILSASLRYGLGLQRFDPIKAQTFDTPLATDEARALALDFRRAHPWTLAARAASPARALRVTRLADLAFYAQPTALAHRYITAPLLAARPLLETILAIGPYTMIAGGVDRALERAAFADLIPAALQRRTRKGDATQYHTRVLEHNRPFVRSLLLDGGLKRMALLRADAVENALASAWMVDGLVKANVITCVLAEAWMQRVESARQRARDVIARSAPCTASQQSQ